MARQRRPRRQRRLERFQSSCSGIEEPEPLTTTSATGGGRYETIENALAKVGTERYDVLAHTKKAFAARGQQMITSVNDWLIFLRNSDPLIGFPLVICGAMLMMFGWRMWKVSVAVAFGLIGLAAGAALTESSNYQWLYAFAGGLILGAASFKFVKYSVGVLGGIIGAAVAMYVLADSRLTQSTTWFLCGFAFISAGALAHTYRRLVVIGVTAILGAVLAMSGVIALVMAAPNMYGTMHALVRNSVFLSVFLILVPSVMSMFYQVSEVHRSQGEL